MNSEQVMILGVGCILLTDEGFGVRVVTKMQERFEFPANVRLVDGGVLGLHLMGVISEADRLIVVDAVRNRGKPGDLYRLEGDAIPARIRAKNSLHQIDLLEALTLCQALGKVPETVILGVEPEDVESTGIDLTPVIARRVDDIIQMVLAELDRLNVPYKIKGAAAHVSCDPLKNCEYTG